MAVRQVVNKPHFWLTCQEYECYEKVCDNRKATYCDINVMNVSYFQLIIYGITDKYLSSK